MAELILSILSVFGLAFLSFFVLFLLFYPQNIRRITMVLVYIFSFLVVWKLEKWRDEDA